MNSVQAYSVRKTSIFFSQGGKGDLGAWKVSDIPDSVVKEWNKLKKEYDYICSRQPLAKAQNNANHLGTLGTGNHFIEVNLLYGSEQSDKFVKKLLGCVRW